MKAQVMNRAWEIAKAAVVRFGGKVKEYFSQALRMAWAEIKKGAGIMAKGSSKGKHGGKTPFGNQKPYIFETYYRQKQGYYGERAYEASDEGNGVINVDYDRNGDWEATKSNTKRVTYTIEHGFYTSGRDVYDHNINWDNIKTVKGRTYGISDILREKGFKWNRERKQWEK